MKHISLFHFAGNDLSLLIKSGNHRFFLQPLDNLKIINYHKIYCEFIKNAITNRVRKVNKEVMTMIYTVTLNPAIDYIITVPELQMGMTNRTGSEKLLPGGKGINISIVLKNLGIETTALGFIAGFTGDEIKRRLEKTGIHTDLIKVQQGYSRINIKLKDVDGMEINGNGPQIGKEDLNQLFAKMEALKKGDFLVLAGSIPGCIPDTIYRDIMIQVRRQQVDVVIDADGKLLEQSLKNRPFLIKPNHHELGGIFGVTLKTREDVIEYAVRMQERGARNVLVSMGAAGAVLADEQGNVHSHEALKGTLVNAVGAGDSMIAGFLAGWMERQDYQHGFCLGLAAGSASAFSEELAVEEQIRELYRQMI